ncbi:hypothetical protein NL676_025387 [Syzygium grande]|nr:hypothetical protein NL676_025387 [Syzygium grande]
MRDQKQIRRETKQKGCRNLQGRGPLEEENRRAKKAACPLCYDHANAIDDPSTALPLSTPAAAQAQPAASRAFNEDAVPDPPPTMTPIVTWTIPQYICCDANYVNSLPTTTAAVQQDTCGFGSLAFGGTACLNPTTVAVVVQDNIFYVADSQAFRSNGNTNLLPTAAANMQGDTWNAARRAFGRPIAEGLPTTSTAAQGVDCKWAHQSMNTEIDPSVQYLFHTVVKQPARALHARNDLVESHPEGVPADWPDEFLDFSHCI